MVFALVSTILIEAFVMWRLTGSKQWCTYNLYCNMVTNPLLNIFIFVYVRIRQLVKTGSFPLYYSGFNDFQGYYLPMLIGEVLVVYSEMRIYELLTKENKSVCFRYSLITNLVSTLFGVVLKIVL